ncbi:MAG: lipocalin family protein [Flavobacteriaceae bacterium]|nr:lipocalin family protein [Flavobacteriaceae bacterium]
MKAFKILATVCLAIVLISCEESENELVNVDQNELVGAWNLTELSQKGTVSVSGIPIPFSSEGSNFDSVLEIAESPNDFSAKGSFTNTTVITNPLGDDVINEERINLNELFARGSWTVENGIITVSQGSVDQAIDIIEFDGTTIKLQFDVEIPIDYDGLSVVSDSTIDMTLMK